MDSFWIALAVCVFASTILAWYPVLVGRPNSSAMLGPAILLTLSSILQLVFIVLAGTDVLTLDHSRRFAAFGLPLCIWAIVLVSRRKIGGKSPLGTAISGLVMWLLLTSLH
jgi:hypothetical protein